MRETHDALDEMVELGHEHRASEIDPDEGREVAREASGLVSRGVMGGGALAAAARSTPVMPDGTSIPASSRPTSPASSSTSWLLQDVGHPAMSGRADIVQAARRI